MVLRKDNYFLVSGDREKWDKNNQIISSKKMETVVTKVHF